MEWSYIEPRFPGLSYTASTFVNASTDSVEPDYREMEGIKIYRSKEGFVFGNCATIAICQAFDIPYNAFKVICKLMKIKEYSDDNDDGLSFFDCKRLINILSSNCGCASEYIPNKGKVTYSQMLNLLNQGKYLTMFDVHLSFAKNGEVFDTYFYNFKSEFKTIPTGWWRIN